MGIVLIAIGVLILFLMLYFQIRKFEKAHHLDTKSFELLMETHANSWHVTKPELKKGHCLLCYSSTGGWTASYDIREKEGELILINPDGKECEYTKFQFASYKLIKYPESEEVI